MKRIIFFIAVAAIGLVACEKEDFASQTGSEFGAPVNEEAIDLLTTSSSTTEGTNTSPEGTSDNEADNVVETGNDKNSDNNTVEDIDPKKN